MSDQIRTDSSDLEIPHRWQMVRVAGETALALAAVAGLGIWALHNRGTSPTLVDVARDQSGTPPRYVAARQTPKTVYIVSTEDQAREVRRLLDEIRIIVGRPELTAVFDVLILPEEASLDLQTLMSVGAVPSLSAEPAPVVIDLRFGRGR